MCWAWAARWARRSPALAKRAAPGEARRRGGALLRSRRLPSKLAAWGVETLSCDLLDRGAVASCRPSPTSSTWLAASSARAGIARSHLGDEHLCAGAGGRALRRRAHRRLLDRLRLSFRAASARRARPRRRRPRPPPGEYANSCLGRERMFEYFSRRHGTPAGFSGSTTRSTCAMACCTTWRARCCDGEPIDVTTGHANVIWQGDANAQALRALRHCTAPTSPLNVTGPEVVCIRAVAEAFGRRFAKPAVIIGHEAESAWLFNAGAGHRALRLSAGAAGTDDRLGGRLGGGRLPSLGKPTQFEVRDGVFTAPAKATRRVGLTAVAGAASAAPAEAAAEEPAPAPTERRLQEWDVMDCVRLSAEPGWNQVAADWRLMIAVGTGIGLFDGRRLAATGLTVPFRGPFAWISMILVTEDYRRRGLRHAADAPLHGRDAERGARAGAGRDARRAGRSTCRWASRTSTARAASWPRARARWRHRRPPASRSGRCTRATCRRSAPTTSARFGADRSDVLEVLFHRTASLAFIAEAGGRPCGFVLGREGRLCDQIGPVVAEDEAMAMALVDAAARRDGRPRLPRRRRPSRRPHRLRSSPPAFSRSLHPDDAWPKRALRRSRPHVRHRRTGTRLGVAPRARRTPERTRAQILQAATAEFAHQGPGRGSRRLHRAARRRQQAHALPLFRQQGGPVPGRAGANLRRDPPRRDRSPSRGARPAGGHAPAGRVLVRLLHRAAAFHSAAQQREPAPRAARQALRPHPPDALALHRHDRRHPAPRPGGRLVPRRGRSGAALHLHRRRWAISTSPTSIRCRRSSPATSPPRAASPSASATPSRSSLAICGRSAAIPK